MKISKGTIIRTIALVVVLINMMLKALGKPLIEYDEGTVMYWLEYFIEVAVIIVTFWKNNSFSPAAIQADKILKDLREDKTEWNIDENNIEGEVE
jgi:SPP1 family holin